MATSRSASRANSNARTEILQTLMADHKRVKKAFRDFEKMDPESDPEGADALVQHTLAELEVHTTLEEELFYPAVREALKEADLVDEAEVEHGSAKQLIEQLRGMEAGDEKYAATFKVLGEYVAHHVREEEKEMFPQLERARGIDWATMQQEMESRRQALEAEHMGTEADDGQDEAAEGKSDSLLGRVGDALSSMGSDDGGKAKPAATRTRRATTSRTV